NREECSGLDQRVACDELVVAEVLRGECVFDRSKDGRVGAQTEERAQENRYAAAPQPPRSDSHDGDLGDLDPSSDERLVETVAERPRCAREEKVRGDEKR